MPNSCCYLPVAKTMYVLGTISLILAEKNLKICPGAHRVHPKSRRSRDPVCKVLGLYTAQCCCQNLRCIVIVRV
jgi:hypothetical protein